MQKEDIDIKFKKNIVFSMIVKGASVLLGLITVNIYLRYLGNSNYGLWITISSIASWAAMGDLGIGNGLRNELAKAYADKDINKQQELISTAIIALVKVSTAIFVILSVVSEIMVAFGALEEEVRIPLYITNVFMCFNFVLGIFASVSHAYQLSYYSSLSQLLYTSLNVLVVWILILTDMQSDLIIFAIINGLNNTIAHIFLIIFVLHKVRISVNLRKINKSYIRSVMSIGGQFFLLQLCGLVLYSTDNVIINGLFGSEDVTVYSIITKVFNTGETLFSILLVSLWSAVTYQYNLKNYMWIVSKIKSLIKIWRLFAIGVIAVAIWFNLLIKLWLGDQAIIYSWDMIVLFAVYSLAGTFGAIFINVANGIGIIKLQLVMAVVEAVFNIPLSIFLAQNCGMGIIGVKIATLICCTGANVIMPIYVWDFLRKKMNCQDGEKNRKG